MQFTSNIIEVSAPASTVTLLLQLIPPHPQLCGGRKLQDKVFFLIHYHHHLNYHLPSKMILLIFYFLMLNTSCLMAFQAWITQQRMDGNV